MKIIKYKEKFKVAGLIILLTSLITGCKDKTEELGNESYFETENEIVIEKHDNLMENEKTNTNTNMTSSTENETERKISEIKEKIPNIFEKLNIDYEDKEKQYDNAYELFKYIIENSVYDENIMNEKMFEDNIYDMEIADIYRCLCEGRSVCTSDAASLALLFRMIGIDSTHITIGEIGNDTYGFHEVVLSNIDVEELICDPTLVRSALKDGDIPDISTRIFMFSENDFFDYLYPTKEIKYKHEQINLKSSKK